MNPGLLAIKKRSVTPTDYASVVLADGPLAYWRLQETSGTVFSDSMQNPANLAITGSPTLLQPGIPGAVNGKSVIFSSGNYANNTAETKTNLSTYSVEVWVYITTQNTAAIPIISTNYSSYVQFVLTLGWTTTGSPTNPQYQVYNGGWNQITAASKLTANTWHYIVATRSSTTATLYIDGTLAATASIPPSPCGGIWLGTSYNNAVQPSAPVYIAEPAIYNKVLTASQISNHYNAGK